MKPQTVFFYFVHSVASYSYNSYDGSYSDDRTFVGHKSQIKVCYIFMGSSNLDVVHTLNGHGVLIIEKCKWLL